MELKYAKDNKKPDVNGWVLSFDYLISISEELEGTGVELTLEEIEAVLLTANGIT